MSKSGVWKYFVKTPTGGKCNICHIDVKTSGNTTNLSNHYKRHHSHLWSEHLLLTKSSANEGIPAETRPTTDKMTKTFKNFFEATSSQPNSPSASSNLDGHKDEDEDYEDSLSSPLSIPLPISSPTDSTCSHSKKKRYLQPLIDDSISDISSYKGGTKSIKLTNMILFMIVRDFLPLNTTEKEGFSQLMKFLAPAFELPSRRTITRLLESKYEIMHDLVKDSLNNISSLTLTCDIWTECLNTKSFLGVTSHFYSTLDKKLETVTIALTELDEGHTADYIKECLGEVCTEYEIPSSKITAVVTDGGANIVKAVSDKFGKSKHLVCFAHMTNLIAQRTIEETTSAKQLIEKIKAIVTFFKQSVKAADQLRKAQTPGPSLKLKQSVPTRWNSTYEMMVRFIELVEIVASVLLKLPGSPAMLNAADIEIIKELIIILKPLQTITKDLCAEKYVTGSKVIPTVNCLNHALKHLSVKTTTGQEFKEKLLEICKKKTSTTEFVHLLSISTLLDPRFKKLHFSNPLALSEAIRKVSDLIWEQHEESEKEGNTESPATELDMTNIWSFHDLLANNSSEKNQDRRGEIPGELKRYLDLPIMSLKSNPMEYWDLHSSVFPKLSPVAIRYLSVVGTSVPCERVFSKTGHIMTEIRNRLSGKHLKEILLLSSVNPKMWM